MLPKKTTSTFGETIQECSRRMFIERYASDISFHFHRDEEDVMVEAHKYVLISRSSVFRAMLCGPLAQEDKAITIPDVQPDIFEEMLRFLYCDEVQLTNDNVFELLYCAKKYLVEPLEVRCLDYIKENLDVDNVCHILDYCLCFDQTELQNGCIRFIQAYTSEVLKTESFLECSENVLVAIAEQDILNLDSESELLDAVLTWAKHACVRQMLPSTPANQRLVLGSILRHIRLSSLLPETIDALLLNTGILCEEEKRQVLLQLETGEAVSPLSSSKRISLEQKHRHEISASRISTHSIVTGNCLTTDIETSRNIRIISLDILQLPVSGPMTTYLVVCMVQNNEVLFQIGIDCNRLTKQLDEIGNPYIRLHFPSPVEIKKGRFSVRFGVKSQSSFATIATASPIRELHQTRCVDLQVTSDQGTCLRAYHYSISL